MDVSIPSPLKIGTRSHVWCHCKILTAIGVVEVFIPLKMVKLMGQHGLKVGRVRYGALKSAFVRDAILQQAFPRLRIPHYPPR